MRTKYSVSKEQLTALIHATRNTALNLRRHAKANDQLSEALLYKATADMLLACKRKLEGGDIQFIINNLCRWRYFSDYVGPSREIHNTLYDIVELAKELLVLHAEVYKCDVVLYGTLENGQEGLDFAIGDIAENTICGWINEMVLNYPGFVPYAIRISGVYYVLIENSDGTWQRARMDYRWGRSNG